MSLLAVLDYHYGNTSKESWEIEYRLISWGEIYPPFQGDREHSTAARFILDEFPFKLFSVSEPYSELPQKLCLTFRAPLQEYKTERVTRAGLYQDQIAKEFAAFLSLISRRRVFAVRQTRLDGLPIEEAAHLYQRSYPQERQSLKEIQPTEVYCLLANLQAMDRRSAQSFILACRLYHLAVEMMYVEPEFAYVFLVMAVEAISSIVYQGFRPDDSGDGRTELEQYLDSQYPGWRQLCDVSTPQRREQIIEMLLTRAYFARRKFRDFLCENVPETFWSETEDDAKPDYLQIVVGPGPDGRGREYVSHANLEIQEWEQIEKDTLKQALGRIYDARSKLIHEGNRLPASIVVGHFRRVPGGAFDEILERGLTNTAAESNLTLHIPPLITFERLVNYCMVEFLRKQRPTMNWVQAQRRIRAHVKVGIDLNTPASKYRFVQAVDSIINSERYNYQSERGFIVSIGREAKIKIPWGMLEECFMQLKSPEGFDGSFFRKRFPLQAQDHSCHVHVVGRIFAVAGLARVEGRHYYIIKAS
jgi:hypothetical protein